MFCNLKNLEKVKSKLEKTEFHYVVPYSLSDSKEILYEALQSVNECSVKLMFGGQWYCSKIFLAGFYSNRVLIEYL